MTRSTAAPTPRKIDVTFSNEQVQAMLDLLKACPLPEQPPVQASKDIAESWELGMDLQFLKDARERFLSKWSWTELEQKLNEFDNYIVELEECDLHFVHARSKRADAVPLLLLHGWPGTMYDFHKVIGKLVDPPEGQKAFHVVVPSLPGYFLSTLPKRESWTPEDIAKVMNHLMVDILGYTKYAAQGGDWGSTILRILGRRFPENVPICLFNMFRCAEVSQVDYEAASPPVRKNWEQRTRFGRTGRGYNEIQSTKPFTIGYAIGTSPLAILAYIGEKFRLWSDPSCLDVADLLNTTALYFLSGSFPTSVMIYQQSKGFRDQLSGNAEEWRMKSKIGYHVFPYEIGGSALADVKQVGDVAFYAEHAKGGHFPALDVPDDFIEDVRKCFVELV